LPDATLDWVKVFGEGAHRAHVEAFAAGDAGLGVDSLNMGFKPPVYHIQDVATRNLCTGLITPHAHYTPIHPLLDQGCPKGNVRSLDLFEDVVLPVDTELISQVLKFALATGIADRAIEGMLNQQEF
jgi:hypothetical protein